MAFKTLPPGSFVTWILISGSEMVIDFLTQLG